MAYNSGLFILLAIVCAVWVIADVWKKNKKLDHGKKVLWTVFAVVFSIATAVVYYVVHKAK